VAPLYPTWSIFRCTTAYAWTRPVSVVVELIRCKPYLLLRLSFPSGGELVRYPPPLTLSPDMLLFPFATCMLGTPPPRAALFPSPPRLWGIPAVPKEFSFRFVSVTRLSCLRYVALTPGIVPSRADPSWADDSRDALTRPPPSLPSLASVFDFWVMDVRPSLLSVCLFTPTVPGQELFPKGWGPFPP